MVLAVRDSLLEKIKDRYTTAEFVELIELDLDDLADYILNDMTDAQMAMVLEDMRLDEDELEDI